MRLNEFIKHLEDLRDRDPGIGEFTVLVRDWGEDYRNPTRVGEPDIDRGEITLDTYIMDPEPDNWHREKITGAVFII
jgi:hypothetical protein